MVLECLAIAMVFALACAAVLMFMRFCGFDPARTKKATRRTQDRS
jgi:hypothetical protein